MAHHLKGAVVERVTHPKTLRESVIRLDKRSMTFYAWEVDQDTTRDPYQSKDGAEVRHWLMEQLKHTTDAGNLEWVPVVKVEYGGSPRHRYRDETEIEGQEVSITVDRFYLALTRDKREWRRLDWRQCASDSATAIPEAERYAASSKHGMGPKHPDAQKPGYLRREVFTLPSFSDGYESATAYFPYTTELWTGLTLLVEQVKQVRQAIGKIVGSKQGLTRLAEIGAGRQPLLLTPPQKAEEPTERGERP